MIEVLSVKGNSVRIRSGIFVADIPVITENGKYRIVLKRDAYYINSSDFRKLVAIVLDAYEQSIAKETSNEAIKSNPQV